mmetsp:Transcript_1918/g.4407  ORF Transcript_1918/g.4407 Transcript_1918/m.4407 type:complete len:202 (-) Transcript_1918:1702-2307(-)
MTNLSCLKGLLSTPCVRTLDDLHTGVRLQKPTFVTHATVIGFKPASPASLTVLHTTCGSSASLFLVSPGHAVCMACCCSVQHTLPHAPAAFAGDLAAIRSFPTRGDVALAFDIFWMVDDGTAAIKADALPHVHEELVGMSAPDFAGLDSKAQAAALRATLLRECLLRLTFFQSNQGMVCCRIDAVSELNLLDSLAATLPRH